MPASSRATPTCSRCGRPAFEPVVACMGTALTEQQLRELGRLTKRLWLAFDGDAAGQSATLRGMELAVAQGFDVKVVALPPGVDPADDPVGFEARLASAQPYVLHRTQVEAQRADDRDAGWRAVTAFLNSVPDSPDRREAWRWANDHFGMTIQLRGGGTAAAEGGAFAEDRRGGRPDRARRSRRRDRPPRPRPDPRPDPGRAVPERAPPLAARPPRRRRAGGPRDARAPRRACISGRSSRRGSTSRRPRSTCCV